MHHGLTGDLPGHLYFGAAYLLLGGWWLIGMFRQGGSVVTEPWDARPHPDLVSLPAALNVWEGWFKFLVPLIGIAGEMRWIDSPPNDGDIIIFQHITAYATMSLAGLADLLVRRGVIPRGTDRFALAAGFLVPGFLFALHGHHLVVSTTLHALLAWLQIGAGALILAEHVRPAPLVRWVRIYATLLAGTWLFQLGWMLYVAGYDLTSQAVVLRSYLFFTWHAVGVGLALAVTLGVGQRVLRARGA